MNKRISKIILKVLNETGREVSVGYLKKYFNNIESEKVDHVINFLESDGLIHRITPNQPDIDIYWIELTKRGYDKCKPWYLKIWKFISDDFTKILSIIFLILSIIATYFSLIK